MDNDAQDPPRPPTADPGEKSKYSAWFLTINNPSSADHRIFEDEGIRYKVYQLEEAPTTGTIHYQGYIYFNSKRSFAALKKLCPRAHLYVAKGTAAQNKEYCTKARTRLLGPWEEGEMPEQGKRSDLADATNDLRTHRSLKRVAEEHPSAFVKFHKGFRELLAATEPPLELPPEDPKPWQQTVIDYCSGPVNRREVYWVVDDEGGKGKSWLAGYLVAKFNAFFSDGGKLGDHAHAFKEHGTTTVAVFDFPRSTKSDDRDLVPYRFIESIKNGMIFSGKYESKSYFFKPVHVVCLSNFSPDLTKFTQDRWKLVFL